MEEFYTKEEQEEIQLQLNELIGACPKCLTDANQKLIVKAISTMFSPKIASIVDGLTKLEVFFDNTESKQAENFRKLLLSMVEDVRVILIKLADRLHNMRTLDSMPENKRLKIAGETLYIYAPLAHRLGLYAIKTELEDLSLKYEHPNFYDDISKKIVESSLRQLNSINEFSAPIKEKLTEAGYKHGNWVEVQIRSERMDEIAEKGFAAHWKYKENSDKESELDNWLKRIRELLENPDDDSLEFLDDFKLNLFASEIVVFTPKGDKITMPNGATALDMAFEIHSDLGYRCIGAKVNYKLVPLSYKLKSGDQVEILTSKKQTPKWEWFDFVTTAKAKARIKQAFRKERKKFIGKGEKILEKYLTEKKLAINSKILRKLQTHYNAKNKDELYFKIGKGIIDLKDASKVLSDKPYNKWVRYWKLSFGFGKEGNKPKVDKKKPLLLTDDKEQHNFTIANCCHPIPGDDVIAYQDDDDNLILHSRNCKVAIKLMSSHGDRIIPAQWESQKILSYIAVIKITGIDSLGIVSKLTKVISDDQNVNMRSIHVESHDGIFEGLIHIYIHHTKDLNNLILKLMKIKGIHTVIRQERQNSK